MFFKKLGVSIILITMLFTSTFNAVAFEEKKKEILTKKEIQTIMLNTVRAITGSHLDKGFIYDKEHTYQFLKAIEFGIYQLKNNPELTGNDIYAYTMGFIDTLYSVTGDCDLYFTTIDFLNILEFESILKDGDKVLHPKTRAVVLVVLLTLDKILQQLCYENSI